MTVYIASSVDLDYFKFLGKTIGLSGYEVIPISFISEADYRALAKASGVKKVWLRSKMYLFYPLYLIYKGITARPGSTFVVTSNTFFAPLLISVTTHFKKIKVIHLLYDLFPDALEAASIIQSDSTQSRLIGNITHLTQKKTDATVYLGSFLKRHAEKRWGHAGISKVIDISTDLSLYQQMNFSEEINGKLIIHYGGQLGHLHDVPTVINCIIYACKSDINSLVEFVFYVSGAQADLLYSELKDYPVKIKSALSSEIWRNDIVNFHIGLVSLSTGGATVCLPSKAYAMMAGGLALLGICPLWSDLGKMIMDLNCGWVINNSKYEDELSLMQDDYLASLREHGDQNIIAIEFYNLLKTLLANPQEILLRRQNAYYGVRRYFDTSMLSEKWSALLQEL